MRSPFICHGSDSTRAGSRPWDEGWTRYIFDQNHIPYIRLVDSDIRKGGLDQRFDVIVLPDNSARAITAGTRGFGEGESSAAPAGNTAPAGAVVPVKVAVAVAPRQMQTTVGRLLRKHRQSLLVV